MKPERRQKRAPRYIEILEIVRARISGGEYPVGDRLPSEAEFCNEFASSRFTVREALRRLQAEGLVERSQGAGSKVVRNSSSGVFVQSHRSVSELVQFSLDTHYFFIESEETVLDDVLAPMVGGSSGETWCVVRGLRSTEPNREPLCLIESYIPKRFAKFVSKLARAQGPLYSILEQESGERITSATQSAQALEMPDHISAAMSVPRRSISLRLMRRYQSSNGTMIASFNWHLGGDRYIHRTNLSLQEIAN